MQNLNTYLNDHLAGSVGALELLDHLIETCDDAALIAFLQPLREDIDADQIVLKNLLGELGGEESVLRKASAWILEKISRAKLQVGTGDHGLGVFQALETLALGITGKQALWRALAAASANVTALNALDYPRLVERAIGQFQRVEAKRLELAVSVLELK